MRTVSIVHGSSRTLVASAKVASDPWSRFRGLMLRASLPDGDALLIDPCYSVHTMFMRFAIDVIFLDSENRVTKLVARMRPFRAAVGRGAKRVLEMPAGAAHAADIQIGDLLRIEAAT